MPDRNPTTGINAGVVDTGGKFVTGVNKTSGKLSQVSTTRGK